MNLDSLNKWLMLAANIGVLAGIIFLVIEVEQNTQAIEATARQQALDGDTQFLVSAINNPEIILAWSKPEPTDEELVILNEALILFFRSRENDYAQYRNGVLDAETWQRYTTSFSALLAWDRNRHWWRNFGQYAFEPAFVDEVNALLPTLESQAPDRQVQDFYRELFSPKP